MPVSRDAILNAIKTGTVTSPAIATKLGIRHQIVRDALRALKALGIVEIAPPLDVDRVPGRPALRWRLRS